MNDAVHFLHTFAQALSAMALYGDNHPARERAIDVSFQALDDLQDADAYPRFTFLEEEVVYQRQPLRELGRWDWAARLSQAGVQRLEIVDRVSRDEFEWFLDRMMTLLSAVAVDTSEQSPLRESSIKWGEVGLRGEDDAMKAAVEVATIAYTLGDEAETVRWLHSQVEEGASLPLLEAEAVVRSLSVAMHADQRIVIPLLELKEFDQYTTTHSINVATLTMALSEFLEMGAVDVRAFGVAGLLHDLGKVAISREVLTKAGKLNDKERVEMNRHPTEGARIILKTKENLELAAVVAYEHHIMLNGGGYPTMFFRRDCHRASKLVHVCDVYDALRTKRPYRDAWPSARVLQYIGERSGLEFDPAIVTAFTRMMQKWEPHVTVVDERTEIRIPESASNGGDENGSGSAGSDGPPDPAAPAPAPDG